MQYFTENDNTFYLRQVKLFTVCYCDKIIIILYFSKKYFLISLKRDKSDSNSISGIVIK